MEDYTNSLEFKQYVAIEKFKGVDFYNINPLLGNYKVCKKAMKMLSNLVRKYGATKIAACESRGFILAGYLSTELKIGCSMVRKAGKTPGEFYSISYGTEYSKDTLEVSKSAFNSTDKVLIVDDVLATGGTATATQELVEMSGAKVVGCAFLIKLTNLDSSQLKCAYESLLFYGNPSKNDIVDEKIKISLALNYTTVLYHPSMKKFVAPLRDICVVEEIKWRKFPDGSPNISFPDNIRNDIVIYIGSMHEADRIQEQFMINSVLPRQGVKSLKMVYPYFPGTMERVPRRGILASAETLMSNLSKPMPLTKAGPSSLCIYDIHALPEQFYVHDNVRIELLSMFLELLKRLSDDFVIVFPDDGACKRFGEQFPVVEEYDRITCGKVRNGDVRSLMIKDRIITKQRVVKRAIIVDDLVQTGGTLHECALLLRSEGFSVVDAFVTHAVFPNQSYIEFIDGRSKASIDKFYVCNTIPGTEDLPKDKFEVISIIPNLIEHINEEYVSNNGHLQFGLGSVSGIKETALKRFISILPGGHENTLNCYADLLSGVNNQPVGYEEIEKGVNNRMNMLRFVTTKSHIHLHFLVTIESGIIVEDNKYYDVACILVFQKTTRKLYKSYTRKVEIPEDYYDLSSNSGFQKTVGEFIAADNDSVTADDWQILFCGRTRVELIVECLCKMFEIC